MIKEDRWNEMAIREKKRRLRMRGKGKQVEMKVRKISKKKCLGRKGGKEWEKDREKKGFRMRRRKGRHVEMVVRMRS